MSPTLLVLYWFASSGRLQVATFLRTESAGSITLRRISSPNDPGDPEAPILGLTEVVVGPVDLGPRPAREARSRVTWAVPARGRA